MNQISLDQVSHDIDARRHRQINGINSAKICARSVVAQRMDCVSSDVARISSTRAGHGYTTHYNYTRDATGSIAVHIANQVSVYRNRGSCSLNGVHGVVADLRVSNSAPCDSPADNVVVN